MSLSRHDFLLFFYGLIFFIVFYRIPIPYTGFYISILLGFIFLMYIISVNEVNRIISSVGFGFIFVFLFLFIFSFAVDVSDCQLCFNFTNSFTLRSLMILLMSTIPAFYLINFYVKGEKNKLFKLIYIAFGLQLFFWFFTFFVPGAKDLIYGLLNMPSHPNLAPHNYDSRGFGYTVEINYTSPFIMVLTLITILGVGNKFTVITIFTQLFNSNNVVISFVIGFLSKITLKNIFWYFLLGSVLVFLFFVIIDYYSDLLPPRLYGEVVESGGMRTISYLIDEHLVFTNKGILEFITGTGSYVFQGGHTEVDVDSGWTIMVNFGGIIFSTLFLFMLFLLSFRAFGINLVGFSWALVGVWLNFKGLLFSPNAYFFIIFLFLFNRFYEVGLKKFE